MSSSRQSPSNSPAPRSSPTSSLFRTTLAGAGSPSYATPTPLTTGTAFTGQSLEIFGKINPEGYTDIGFDASGSGFSTSNTLLPSLTNPCVWFQKSSYDPPPEASLPTDCLCGSSSSSGSSMSVLYSNFSACCHQKIAAGFVGSMPTAPLQIFSQLDRLLTKPPAASSAAIEQVRKRQQNYMIFLDSFLLTQKAQRSSHLETLFNIWTQELESNSPTMFDCEPVRSAASQRLHANLLMDHLPLSLWFSHMASTSYTTQDENNRPNAPYVPTPEQQLTNPVPVTEYLSFFEPQGVLGNVLKNQPIEAHTSPGLVTYPESRSWVLAEGLHVQLQYISSKHKPVFQVAVDTSLFPQVHTLALHGEATRTLSKGIVSLWINRRELLANQVRDPSKLRSSAKLDKQPFLRDEKHPGMKTLLLNLGMLPQSQRKPLEDQRLVLLMLKERLEILERSEKQQSAMLQEPLRPEDDPRSMQLSVNQTHTRHSRLEHEVYGMVQLHSPWCLNHLTTCKEKMEAVLVMIVIVERLLSKTAHGAVYQNFPIDLVSEELKDQYPFVFQHLYPFMVHPLRAIEVVYLAIQQQQTLLNMSQESILEPVERVFVSASSKHQFQHRLQEFASLLQHEMQPNVTADPMGLRVFVCTGHKRLGNCLHQVVKQVLQSVQRATTSEENMGAGIPADLVRAVQQASSGHAIAAQDLLNVINSSGQPIQTLSPDKLCALELECIDLDKTLAKTLMTKSHADDNAPVKFTFSPAFSHHTNAYNGRALFNALVVEPMTVSGLQHAVPLQWVLPPYARPKLFRNEVRTNGSVYSPSFSRPRFAPTGTNPSFPLSQGLFNQPSAPSYGPQVIRLPPGFSNQPQVFIPKSPSADPMNIFLQNAPLCAQLRESVIRNLKITRDFGLVIKILQDALHFIVDPTVLSKFWTDSESLQLPTTPVPPAVPRRSPSMIVRESAPSTPTTNEQPRADEDGFRFGAEEEREVRQIAASIPLPPKRKAAKNHENGSKKKKGEAAAEPTTPATPASPVTPTPTTHKKKAKKMKSIRIEEVVTAEVVPEEEVEAEDSDDVFAVSSPPSSWY